MGTIVTAHCKNCSFNTNEMRLGGGRYTYQTYAGFPYMCEKCKNIFVGNYLTDVLGCSFCRSDKITPYNELQQNTTRLDNVKDDVFIKKYNVFSSNTENGQIGLTSNYYKCPKCDDFALEFKYAGNWD